jgi:hypothetical protein
VDLVRAKELRLNPSKQVLKNKQERQNVKLGYLKSMFGFLVMLRLGFVATYIKLNTST